MVKIKKSPWTVFKEYSLIILGLMLYVLAWVVFLLPNNLVGGGVSGLSAIVYYATGFDMGYTYFIINTLLLLIALKILGPSFGFKTVFAVFFVSVMLNVMPHVVPESVIHELAIENGKLLSTIIGGVMYGVGVGLCMSQGGSTGGTDIIALIVNKFRPMSPGRLLLLMDVVIIGSSMFFPSYDTAGELIPFGEKLATVIYGLILITVSGYTVDLYLSGTKQSVQVFIISRKYAEIADAITKDLHRGVTLIPAEGWYTKTQSNVLMVLTRKADLNLLLKYVKLVDPQAFLSVANAMGVYGEGFDTIKLKAKKTTRIPAPDEKVAALVQAEKEALKKENDVKKRN